MAEVHCLYKWDEKKARQFEPWVKAHEQRYVLFIEDDPASVILNTSHSRIRCVSISDHSRDETFERIVWEFLYLPFSFEVEDHPLLKQLASVQREINFRAFDFADQGLQLLQNFRHNLLREGCFAKDLYGKLNAPAIICGGGPSLAAVQSSLKRLQNKALIIGCGAGVEALLKMGITPHFAAHVDPASLHRFTRTEIPLFYQLRTDAGVVSKYEGRRFLVSGTGNFPLEGWVQKKWEMEPEFDGGWTVGTFGVALAAALGCTEIVLAGIDLAAAPGAQIYAPGVKTTSTSENFVPMKNREGQSVISRPDWVLAAEWLNQFAKEHAHLRFGTISRRGLEIPFIPLIDLEKFQGVDSISSLVEKALELPKALHGEEIWKEIESSFKRSLELCHKILQEMEKIFPQSPAENGTCALLEHDLGQELVFQQVLQPLWHYWQHPILRHNTAGEWGVHLNRILFFHSLCEKIDAL
jgi:hypothetical protein